MRDLMLIALLGVVASACGGNDTTCYPNEIRCSGDKSAVLQCAETGDSWATTTCSAGTTCKAVAALDPTTGVVYTDLRCVP
jgi:hypothetical protein